MIKLLALAGLGYAGYRYYQNQSSGSSVAFAGNQSGKTIRDAGPEAMRSEPTRAWTKTDEESDQSFPASDPPANY
ncbi:hypothetical protein [Qipengyuania sediminis]|uniref:hypothetical protein n=1 Tax=Qipengyuania sediminis TaxID=1532023 RepID=UPI001059FCCD|nr:hypothetical protein [Qipengyuania sediminis]